MTNGDALTRARIDALDAAIGALLEVIEPNDARGKRAWWALYHEAEWLRGWLLPPTG